jgi:hypothetical protein
LKGSGPSYLLTSIAAGAAKPGTDSSKLIATTANERRTATVAAFFLRSSVAWLDYGATADRDSTLPPPRHHRHTDPLRPGDRAPLATYLPTCPPARLIDAPSSSSSTSTQRIDRDIPRMTEATIGTRFTSTLNLIKVIEATLGLCVTVATSYENPHARMHIPRLPSKIQTGCHLMGFFDSPLCPSAVESPATFQPPAHRRLFPRISRSSTQTNQCPWAISQGRFKLSCSTLM